MQLNYLIIVHLLNPWPMWSMRGWLQACHNIMARKWVDQRRWWFSSLLSSTATHKLKSVDKLCLVPIVKNVAFGSKVCEANWRAPLFWGEIATSSDFWRLEIFFIFYFKTNESSLMLYVTLLLIRAVSTLWRISISRKMNRLVVVCLLSLISCVTVQEMEPGKPRHNICHLTWMCCALCCNPQHKKMISEA